jgi:hypothetical protein
VRLVATFAVDKNAGVPFTPPLTPLLKSSRIDRAQTTEVNSDCGWLLVSGITIGALKTMDWRLVFIGVSNDSMVSVDSLG